MAWYLSFSDNPESRGIVDVFDGSLESLGVIPQVTQNFIITCTAQESSDVPGTVVVVDRELPPGTSRTLADVALTTLRLADRVVLLGCDAVRLGDVPCVARSSSLLPNPPVVRSAPRPGVRSLPPRRDAFCLTVLTNPCHSSLLCPRVTDLR